MRKSAQVILFSMVACLIFSVIAAVGFMPTKTTFADAASIFLISFGTISLIVGTIDFLVALILIAASKHDWMKAFFIASGISMLIGLGVCGATLAVSSV